jgi:hypothetical protein
MDRLRAKLRQAGVHDYWGSLRIVIPRNICMGGEREGTFKGYLLLQQR